MSQKNLISIAFLLIISMLILQPITSNSLVEDTLDSHISSPCTIFTASIGDTVYFGNNEDYKTMSLVVDSANQAAVGLYEKHNFVKGWKRVTHVWKKE